MKKKTLTYIVLGLLVGLGLSLFWNYKQFRDLQEQPTKIQEKIVVKYKEKKDSMPDAKKETVVGTIKIPVPKPNQDPLFSDNLSENALDSVGFSDNLSDIPDSIEVSRTQKVYSDSSYTAYVSGYEPRLDSIFVREKIVEHSIVETRTVATKKFRRWNVGLVGGYGYGFKSKEFEPFVGFGLTISIF